MYLNCFLFGDRCWNSDCCSVSSMCMCNYNQTIFWKAKNFGYYVFKYLTSLDTCTNIYLCGYNITIWLFRFDDTHGLKGLSLLRGSSVARSVHHLVWFFYAGWQPIQEGVAKQSVYVVLLKNHAILYTFGYSWKTGSWSTMQPNTV